MSLRALAKELSLAAHGTLVDYEHGRRIPPEDLIIGCERVFGISDGALRNLRDKALAERANQQAGQLLADPQPAVGGSEPAPDEGEPPVPPRPRLWHRRRSVLIFAGLVTAVAVGTGVAVWWPGTTTSASTGVSRTLVNHWGVCWGGPVGTVQQTDVVTYEGINTVQITVNKPSTAGLFATCTSTGLKTLRPGMKVTVYLRTLTAEPGAGGVNFWVYNSTDTATYSPETPKGIYERLPTTTGWQKYTWTVPRVDVVHSLGVEVESTTGRPLIVWLGAVTW